MTDLQNLGPVETDTQQDRDAKLRELIRELEKLQILQVAQNLTIQSLTESIRILLARLALIQEKP